VFSGRNVIESSPALNVYISLRTISVPAPTERANSSVASKIGVRISRNPYRENTS